MKCRISLWVGFANFCASSIGLFLFQLISINNIFTETRYATKRLSGASSQ